ncbi:hypothetical protein J1N35_030587 [Gossypium stocksii]|uniref:Uncharacterized protein n=1 Tax=Gossypium stocksii TaxID=47602 RepID=A0A9D3V0C6_9ROSI|nr:hypothetical protein J1N35_030587 [Gossypium stocksii]
MQHKRDICIFPLPMLRFCSSSWFVFSFPFSYYRFAHVLYFAPANHLTYVQSYSGPLTNLPSWSGSRTKWASSSRSRVLPPPLQKYAKFPRNYETYSRKIMQIQDRCAKCSV